MNKLSEKIFFVKESWLEFWDFIKTCVTFKAFAFLFLVYLFFNYTIYKIAFSGSEIKFICSSIVIFFSLFGFFLSLERAIEVGINKKQIFTGTPPDNLFFELLLWMSVCGIILFFTLRKIINFIIWLCAVFCILSFSLLSFIFISDKNIKK